jgi:triosephosphate isomerase
MNLSRLEAKELAKELVENYKPQADKEVIIAPQFPMLIPLAQMLKNTAIKLSSQTCASEQSGAYTGEVSPSLLAGICDYCIVGHSERRNIFKESSQVIAKKFFLLQELGIIPIFCVGENLKQRESGELESVLREQINPILHTTNAKFLIAYEPVWAIGTGKVATSEQVAAVHLFISDLLEKKLQAKQKIPILYGGSVKAENAAELLKIDNLHGLLVGGASLKKEDFLKIITSK